VRKGGRERKRMHRIPSVCVYFDVAIATIHNRARIDNPFVASIIATVARVHLPWIDMRVESRIVAGVMARVATRVDALRCEVHYGWRGWGIIVAVSANVACAAWVAGITSVARIAEIMSAAKVAGAARIVVVVAINGTGVVLRVERCFARWSVVSCPGVVLSRRSISRGTL
jgi:hypothetical protein